ncbi:MAG: EF-hand domain-containing protein [Pseudomonadota bacterium]
MRRNLSCLLSTVLVSVLSTIPAAHAQNTADSGSQEKTLVAPDVSLNVRHLISQNPDSYLTRVINQLYQMNETGVVTRQDVAAFQAVQQVKRRTKLIQAYLHLDLDGDGVLTASERASVEKSEPSQTRSRYQLLFLKGDKDNDGAISYKELIAFGNERSKKVRSHGPNSVEDLMAFDLNGDNKVDSKEVSEAIDRIAKEAPEVRRLAKRNRHQRPGNNRRNVCTLPKADPAAKVVFLGGYEGSAISSASVAGLNATTTTAALHIEPGDQPLYIFTRTHDPLIWRISGATDRITNFVVQPRKTKEGGGAGVVGLRKSQITFTEPGACVGHFAERDTAKARIARARLSGLLGRSVDTFVGEYTLHEVSLPSGTTKGRKSARTDRGVTIQSGNGLFRWNDGKLTKLNTGRKGRTAAELQRFYPGGIVEIDHEQVISPKPASSYDVLPQQAGLLQLIKEGAITLTRDGFYLIEKDISRFPAGLYGGHSVKFMIAKGVKMPKGSPGHSTVYLEETGQCIGRTACR